MTNFQTHRPSLDEILDETPRTPAEEKLLAACKTDGELDLGDEVPGKATPENSIRGELIRYLMMGGCEDHPPNARGVLVSGAYLTGQLNLDGCLSPLDLHLVNSRFEQQPNFSGSEVGSLALTGSHLPGVFGDGMRVQRNLSMNRGFCSTETVFLMGVQVGGELSCTAGRITPENGPALRAHGLVASRGLFLRDGFYAGGLVDLNGAQISGQFDCNGGRFEPKTGTALKGHNLSVVGSLHLNNNFYASGLVDLLGTQITGQLTCNRGCFEGGLDLQSVRIEAAFVFRSLRAFHGGLDLLDAHVSCLMDDAQSWDMPDRLFLNGFRFDTVQSKMSASDRLHVLTTHAGQDAETVFHSQPYTQLAGYYRRNGQRQAAARVSYDLEKYLARVELAQAYAATDGTWETEWPRFAADFAYAFKWGFQKLAGYGYRPLYAFYWAVGVVAFSMIYFQLVFAYGQMVPNSDVILTSAEWLAIVADNPEYPAKAWSETDSGSDYETFSAIGYGFDLFVPLDALGQELAWAPSLSRGDLGWYGHYLRWPIQVMGWVLTAIGAALLTGLIGRERE